MKKNEKKGFQGQLTCLNGNLHPQKFFLVFSFETEKNRSRNFFFSGERETKQLCVGEERRAFLFLLLSASERKIGLFFERKILTFGGKHNTSLFFSFVFFSLKVLPFM